MTAPRPLQPPPALRDLTEKEWAAQVAQLAKQLGWRRYHTFRSDRSESGWPDEALVRERLILLELKSEKGRLAGEQRAWLRDLVAAGVECYLVRPCHFELLAAVLAVRMRYDDFPSDQRGERARAARSHLNQALREELQHGHA